MKIKDVEERTGLSRSNVRFYEKEKLIEPSRNESNGYRDYSENDVENIKKIAYLRTLGISIEDIRSIISGKVTLQETLERQNEILNSQITDLNKAKRMCEKMLGEESISYEKLQVEQYVTDFQDYWKDNQTVFKLDSVSFLYIWGSMLTWITITVLCLIIEEILKRGLQKVKETGACVIGMPSKDTVKLSDEEGYVKETPNRKCVWTIQTPQIFSYSLIREAHDSIRQKDMSKITDDAMVVEQETGAKVALAEGSYQNIKITTPEDLDIAEAFLKH